jgi:hypothetical protein
LLTDEEMMEISEQLAEAGHAVWKEKRKREKGWHAPEDCLGPQNDDLCMSCEYRIIGIENIQCKGNNVTPIRGKCYCPLYKQSPCPNCHPCMRPYKDLPDSEKELPRAYPALFFNVLEELGYAIIHKPIPTELPDISLVKRVCHIDGKRMWYCATTDDIADKILDGTIPMIPLCSGNCAQELKQQVAADLKRRREDAQKKEAAKS